MKPTRVIDIREGIFAENRGIADLIRSELKQQGTFLVNVMGSPGAGKTSLLVELVRRFGSEHRIGVVEGDVDSTVDADLLNRMGATAVQIRTGGFCHLDAVMVRQGLELLLAEPFDIVFIENIGNLICPADHDTGAHLNMVILSVPEGDDKPLKYPLIFRKADVLVVAKIDSPDFAFYDLAAVRERVTLLNERIEVFPLSCRSGIGVDELVGFLRRKVADFSPGASDRKRIGEAGDAGSGPKVR